MNIHINNKVLIGSLVIAAGLVATSCQDDYLDTNPTSSVGTSDALGTTQNAYSVLNGVAKLMTTQHYRFNGFSGENHVMIKMECYPSENYNYNYYASGWAVLFNQRYNTMSNSIYDSYAWYYYYSIVGGANSIIVNIDNAEGPEGDKKFIKASALTFRAYAFEKLARYYCNRWQDSNNGASQGLVLRLDESTGDLPYSTLAETYKRIYDDLDEAIRLFDESEIERAKTDVWIPNVNAAHAIYARTALTRQDYNKALSEAKLARQGFPLMSVAEYQNGFCNPTSEWILGSYGSAEENNWYWSYGTQYSCNGYYANGTPCGAGSIGRELINRIPDNDARKALFITEDKFPDYDWEDPNVCDSTYCIVFDDDLAEEIADYCDGMTPNGLDKPYQAGYYYLGGQLKFWVFDTPGVSYLPFIRSSEMLLIEAEANYFLNKPTDAQNALVELNANSGRNPNYTCSLTGDALFNEIKDYRELELWGEGFSWSDYKRWNLPIVRKTKQNGGNTHPSVAVTIRPDQGNKWTWAVPLAETDYNDALKLNQTQP